MSPVVSDHVIGAGPKLAVSCPIGCSSLLSLGDSEALKAAVLLEDKAQQTMVLQH
jgi:hypothetical protein